MPSQLGKMKGMHRKYEYLPRVPVSYGIGDRGPVQLGLGVE